MAKPIWSLIWANLAGGTDVVAPDTTKQDNGWESGEKPPHSAFNWFWQKICNTFKILNDQGVLEWDSATTYPADAIVYHSGSLYVSNSGGNINNTPSSTSTFWQAIRKTNISISATVPVNGVIGNLWVDTTTGILKYCSASYPTNTWIPFSFGADSVLQKTTATGSANALIASFSKPYNSLNDILLVMVKTAYEATSSAPTIDIDGLGPIVIKKANNVPLDVADVPANYNMLIGYDEATNSAILFNPWTGKKREFMIVADIKAQGTDGGSVSVANTVFTRTLNTVISNSISGASLSANEITLPKGTYAIRGKCVNKGCGNIATGIKNVTDNTITYGLNVDHDAVTVGLYTLYESSISQVDAQFTINSTKSFSLVQIARQTRSGSGCGLANNFAGISEKYAEVVIEKIG